jgi:hypothetical protein
MDRHAQQPGATQARHAARVLVLLTEELTGPELIAELRGHLGEDARGSEVLVVAPAVEKTAFRHLMGDVDEAAAEAERRLDLSIDELLRAGISAEGAVGDSDPVMAAEDALRQFQADEILIVAHSDDQSRWFEEGLFERAEESLTPPLRMVEVRRDERGGDPHLAGVEEAGAGLVPSADAEHEMTLSQNLPRFNRGDLFGIVVAVVGTILAIVFAALGPGQETAGGAAQILIAMALALINMAHVVGLLLLESVHYRGGWQRFFRDLSMTATPLAVVVNGLIALLA